MPGSRRRLRATALAAVLLAATACESPTVPGESPAYDPTALSGGVLFAWPLGATVLVYVDQSGGAGAASLVAAVDRSLLEWEGATRYGELRLRRTLVASEAGIVVRAQSAPPVVDETVCGGGIGDGAGFTLVCLDGDGARVLPLVAGGGRVKVAIRVRTEGGALDALVAHELGHALGIAGHSPDPADVMHAAPSAVRPTDRDRRTLRYVLHQPADARL